MDSRTPGTSSIPISAFRLPGWAASRGRDHNQADAAFSAGIALKTLDDLVRSDPVWAGCWRSRQALKCAGIAVRVTGRNAGEHALRDAVLLTAPGDDPGPDGRFFLATQRLSARTGGVTTEFVSELAELLALRWDDHLAAMPGFVDAALQSGRAVPFAMAELISAIIAVRPDAEMLAFLLADIVLSQKLNWPKPVPLLLSERYGSAFRTIGGRGRVRPSEPAFEGVVCLALVDAIEAGLRSAAEIARRSDQLLAVAPKLRTKGADAVISRLLNEDAVPAATPGANLSRWASTRLFERLMHFGAVRELSGRSSFRIYGL
ncbi:DUF1403 family protein [Hoeflea ulvae]|uniref:DUF1403 family protein n=1 Tax=Hoeflea ulvae TaxID=2983764 RepID=A0ABT3YMN4_9HYPH|nr:DUF1403 family protein [Hoeflea ulvae]MCY0096975.1 DUF1403 family protein [Hoeflea ulvae]